MAPLQTALLRAAGASRSLAPATARSKASGVHPHVSRGQWRAGAGIRCSGPCSRCWRHMAPHPLGGDAGRETHEKRPCGWRARGLAAGRADPRASLWCRALGLDRSPLRDTGTLPSASGSHGCWEPRRRSSPPGACTAPARSHRAPAASHLDLPSPGVTGPQVNGGTQPAPFRHSLGCCS